MAPNQNFPVFQKKSCLTNPDGLACVSPGTKMCLKRCCHLSCIKCWFMNHMHFVLEYNISRHYSTCLVAFVQLLTHPYCIWQLHKSDIHYFSYLWFFIQLADWLIFPELLQIRPGFPKCTLGIFETGLSTGGIRFLLPRSQCQSILCIYFCINFWCCVCASVK